MALKGVGSTRMSVQQMFAYYLIECQWDSMILCRVARWLATGDGAVAPSSYLGYGPRWWNNMGFFSIFLLELCWRHSALDLWPNQFVIIEYWNCGQPLEYPRVPKQRHCRSAGRQLMIHCHWSMATDLIRIQSSIPSSFKQWGQWLNNSKYITSNDQ